MEQRGVMATAHGKTMRAYLQVSRSPLIQKFLFNYSPVLHLALYNNIGLLLACVNVNHIYDNPGYYTCDCVASNDQCLIDEHCEVEEKCPESNGQPTGIQGCHRCECDT